MMYGCVTVQATSLSHQKVQCYLCSMLQGDEVWLWREVHVSYGYTVTCHAITD